MSAFYNEIDAFAANWLEALLENGEITHGRVERRSIADLRGWDLEGFQRVHFFAGIGGWDYALRLAGWPADVPVWTGSCPCQPFSAAGKGLGERDPRHLWPEFRRLISECRPPVVFGEQVASRAGREWLAGVRADLEGMGYAVGAADLCAACVGAPHIRQRLYWVAYAKDTEYSHSGASCRRSEGTQVESGRSRGTCGMGHSDESGPQGRVVRPVGCSGQRTAWSPSLAVECKDGWRRFGPGAFPLAHGVSSRVGRLRGYGNAIVPQVAATFVMAFMETMDTAGLESRQSNEVGK